MMNVPFVDLKAQHQSLKEEIMKAIGDAIDSTQFIGGKNVQLFEEEFAHFCHTRYGIGVNSGTDALRFALIAAGMKTGDEVITVPHTFIATTEAISQAGGKIVFVDIHDETDTMDPDHLETEVKKRLKRGNSVKAVIPVHLYGQVSDMEPILDIANRYHLIVIEDACQAHGASYFDRAGKEYKAGSLGLAGCFSFYPGKNLGACGEGGAVVTNDEDIAHNVRMLRDHGQGQKYYHEMEGYNGRLDSIQAGILRIKLRQLATWNEKRRKNASLYNSYFRDIPGVITPVDPQHSVGVYHLYVIRIKDRDRIQKQLAERGISTGLHYPVPLHLQQAYKEMGYQKGDFPVTEKHCEELLSLPMFPELTDEQIRYVVNSIKECMI